MGLSAADLQALGLTLKLAGSTTVLLLLLATPLAWCLVHSASRWRLLLSTLATLPLVLPPSVLGFYLLLAMGPNGPLGQFTLAMGWGLWSFSFTGLLIGSILFSLPFAMQPLLRAFEDLGQRPLEVAATLGASPMAAFFTVALPLARPGLISAAILSFAHTVGEFGVVLMLGGNIPGQTQTVSTQIYSHVEAMEYAQAHSLAGLMLVFSFVILLVLGVLRPQSSKADL